MPTRKRTDYPKSAETSLEIASRELQTLEPLFKLPITKLGLDGWVGGSSPRAELVADTIWGTIRWAKSLGRPTSPTLAQAFVIEHVHHQVETDYTPGKTGFVDLFPPHTGLTKWDGPEDETFFRVSFVSEGLEGQQTRISVRFADHIRWPTRVHVPGRTYLEIEPAVQHFLKPKSLLVLAPFEVIAKPYSRVVG